MQNTRLFLPGSLSFSLSYRLSRFERKSTQVPYSKIDRGGSYVYRRYVPMTFLEGFYLARHLDQPAGPEPSVLPRSPLELSPEQCVNPSYDEASQSTLSTRQADSLRQSG